MFRQKTFTLIWLIMLFIGLVTLSIQAHKDESEHTITHSHAGGEGDHSGMDSNHEGVDPYPIGEVPAADWSEWNGKMDCGWKDINPSGFRTDPEFVEGGRSSAWNKGGSCTGAKPNIPYKWEYQNHSHTLEPHTHDEPEQRPVVTTPKPAIPPGPKVPPAVPEMPTVPKPVPEIPERPPVQPEQPVIPKPPVVPQPDPEPEQPVVPQPEPEVPPAETPVDDTEEQQDINTVVDAPYYPERQTRSEPESQQPPSQPEKPPKPLSKNLVISEMMLDMGIRNRWPQWIEIHNLSDALYANLSGWKIVVENEKEKGLRRSFTLRLKGVRIKSGQTTLITSYRFRNSGEENFLQENIVAIYENHRNAIRMRNYDEQIFSFTGLNIKLIDPDENVVDEVGNIDGDRRTADKPAWDILASENPKFRSSIMRVYSNKKPVDGTEAYAWVLAENAHARNKRHETYYGNPRDISGPGYHSNFPLPVQMSAFSAKLDGEKIFIEWTTSSELNNAGFNLLRSDSENGTYVRINKALIPGRGTVSEMTSYVWEDKSANENTAYYYRIEDVSFNGDLL